MFSYVALKGMRDAHEEDAPGRPWVLRKCSWKYVLQIGCPGWILLLIPAPSKE